MAETTHGGCGLLGLGFRCLEVVSLCYTVQQCTCVWRFGGRARGEELVVEHGWGTNKGVLEVYHQHIAWRRKVQSSVPRDLPLWCLWLWGRGGVAMHLRGCCFSPGWKRTRKKMGGMHSFAAPVGRSKRKTIAHGISQRHWRSGAKRR
ncbi:unnamed protein product [Ectocarpus sp. 13 AM-2016]